MARLLVVAWPHTALLFSFVGGIAEWIVAVIPFIRIANELARASRAGEAPGIPLTSRGLPPVVIFTKDILPRVELERRILMWAIISFFGFILAGLAIVQVYGPQ